MKQKTKTKEEIKTEVKVEKEKSKIRLMFVGNLYTLPYSPDHAGVMQAMKQMKESGDIEAFEVADPHYHHSTGKNIVETVREFGPTIIVHGMTDSLSSRWIVEIGKSMPGIVQVMSMWDYRPTELRYDNLWDTWKESGPYLKLLTLSNRNQLDWWRKDFGVMTMYWPHGCVVKDVEYDKQFEYDCVFVGDRHMAAPYNERVALIDEIDRQLKQQGKRIEWINKPGGDANKERGQLWQDLGKIYYSSKTVLDISHFWDADGYASGRFFYTSGLGGCAVAKRFKGCEELFPEGTKAYFDTPEEAVKKIMFYIENEGARNLVKTKGKEWANKYHNYTDRFHKLFNILGL